MRHFLLTSALILTGTVAIAPSAFAQTVDVPFTGTVGGACTFGQVTPGKLAVNSATDPTKLAALNYSGGVVGRVSVTCNSSAKVAVSKPQQTGGPQFNPVSSVAEIRGANGYTESSSNFTGLQIPTGISTLLEVNMIVDKGSTLEPGTYDYKVTLTVTP